MSLKPRTEPCESGKHARDERNELYCKNCGWAICWGCENAFDLMCDLCDDPHEFD